MNDTIILDSSVPANFYIAEIAPDNRAWPYARPLTDFYITNDISGLADKG